MAAARAALPVRWRREDPGLVGVRRAARAALLLPAAFAVAKFGIRDPYGTTFVVFGCFALLVMADFGGSRRSRAAAYVATTLVSAALVALGTLASSAVWAAVAAMLLVGLAVQFVGVFGGYALAAQPALLLSFVLAISTQVPPTAVGGRVAGLLIAGAVSTLGGALLWPRFEHTSLRRRAAAACRAVAELVRAQREGRDASSERRASQDAVVAVCREYAATPKRPAGPARRHRALVKLLAMLEWAVALGAHPFPAGPPARRPCIEEGDRLAAAVVDTFRASGDVLTGGTPPDLEGLEEARIAHREALDRWAAESLRAGRPAEEVVEGLDVDLGLRVSSYVAQAVGTNAIIAAGGRPAAELRLPAGTPLEGAWRVVVRVGRTVRTHLEPTSSVLHGCVRVAIGLAQAVLVARLLRLDHAFWVVLGTLSVLRSNALSTGRTAIQAIGGTMAGLAVGTVYAIAVGGNSAILWATLPITVFLAGYAAKAVSFVVGQAAFTLNMIVLFNLLAPQGWLIGVVRLDDVAVGVGISLVVGLLLWPHGARRELSLAAAAMYRAVAAFLASSCDRVLEGGERDVRARGLAVRASDRADEALDRFLNERGAKPLNPQTAADLLASAHHCIVVGDVLNVVADLGYRAGGCAEGTGVVREQTGAMHSALLRMADRLEGGTGPAGRPVSGDALREAALACLRRWREDPSGGGAAIAVVAVAQWADHLGRLVADLEESVAAAAASARVPWWR